MKIFTFLLFTLLTFHFISYSQGCLPEGIIFTNQTQIDSFQINYPSCTEIEGNVSIGSYEGTNITNCDGLNVLTNIEGSLSIFYNNLLANISGLENLTSIGGLLNIENNVQLTSLVGLENLTSVGGEFIFAKNPAIPNLDALNSLTAVGESLIIVDNDTLTNISGLANLTSLGGSLSIDNNDILSSLEGLENITNIEGFILIERNGKLNNLQGLHNITHIENGFSISRNDELINLQGLESVTDVGGSIHISYNPSLKSIAQLNNVSGILSGDIDIIGNDSLSNLNGLNNITSIGSYLWFEDNDALIDLSGLDNLASIDLSFVIMDNDLLTSLTGLDNISDIGGLFIENNISLNDISSLYNVTSEISLQLEITGNHSLTSLKGIDLLNLNSIYYLAIVDNELLSECHVFSICHYMGNYPSSAYFYNNAQGCNTFEEVQAACDTVSVEEIHFDNTFSISPNPCSGFVNLRFRISDQGIVKCELFEISGVKVKEIFNEDKMPGNYEIKIDLSDIPAGIYFCTLKTKNGIQTRKMIKL